MDRRNHYLIDVKRVRKNYPDLKRFIISHSQNYDARTVLIERAGLGLSLYQELWDNPPRGMPKPVGIKVKEDKLVRMETQSAMIENGHVYLPQDADWKDIFLHELMAFPSSKYDDQVDSLSQYLKWSEDGFARRSLSGVGAMLYTYDRKTGEGYWTGGSFF